MIPALVQWELTARCNYQCLHCYRLESKTSASPALELSDSEMKKIADLIIKHKLFFVTFTGGEPLLRKRLLFDLAQSLFDAGIRLSLNTNLTLVDESVLNVLRIHRLLISCPSSLHQRYKEITRTGNYLRFERNLALVIDAKIDHTVNMVVHKLNRFDVRRTAMRMAELGVRQFAATPMSLNTRAPRLDLMLTLNEVQKVLRDLIWIHEELGMSVDVMEALPTCAIPPRAFELRLPFIYRGCHAGERNGTISPLGEVRPCGHNPQIFGQILEEPISAIWERMSGWRTSSGNQHFSCVACDLFNTCGGGCRVDVLSMTGNSSGVHPYMTEKGRTSFVLPSEPMILEEGMMIRPSRSFQSRPENGGWLVASGSSRNIIHVTSDLYQFLNGTREMGTIALGSLAQKCQTTFADLEFQRVMKMLLQKAFLVIVPS